MHPAIGDRRAALFAKPAQTNARSRGISAAPSADMPNNISQFASIETVLLTDVQGGCGGRRRRCGGHNKNVNIVNNYGAAPAPAPAAAAPTGGGGTAVDVNVGYQQTA